MTSMPPPAQTRSPLQATVVQWLVEPGANVQTGDVVVILEAMKMEHEVRSASNGRVASLQFTPGELVNENELLLIIEQTTLISREHSALSPFNTQLDDGLDGILDAAAAPVAPAVFAEAAASPDIPSAAPLRADLQAVLNRHARGLDAHRVPAVAKRQGMGLRTARQNVADLCDEAAYPGNFIEYGALAIAAQTRRRTLDDLIDNTPADGMVTGIGSINAAQFGAEASRAVVMAYDFTVLAGTQGMRNHQKTDRLLGLALAQKLPVVLFAEGGGGRPGDVDSAKVAGLNVASFASFARLNGRVPVVGIVEGRCFAGNAALLGCADVIIATRNSNIGMGGPAMVEGGGLGVYQPEQIGPSSVQHANGVIDILVDNEAKAVAAAKHYLSFFQGSLASAGVKAGTDEGPTPEALSLRSLVPENRLRVYNTHGAMAGVVDAGSLLDLRTGFGKGIHTALGRIDGRPVGLMANNPHHLGGAIDADAADKASRFMQLCNAHGLPLVSFVDTPGFMVGPEIEALAQVRHVSRMFIAAGHLRVPLFAVVLRKGYGLGAMAMTGGGFAQSAFTIAWPTGEFGGMGLEGAVKLGYRKELEAKPAGPEREALYDQLVAEQYEKGGAINMAAHLEIDAVIDPAHTRDWLMRGLQSAKIVPRTEPLPVDAW